MVIAVHVECCHGGIDVTAAAARRDPDRDITGNKRLIGGDSLGVDVVVGEREHIASDGMYTRV